MDARTMFRMLKPHLDQLNPNEKKELSKLISTPIPGKVCCHHRKVYPLKKAKEKLKVFCRTEMAKEQRQRQLSH